MLGKQLGTQSEHLAVPTGQTKHKGMPPEVCLGLETAPQVALADPLRGGVVVAAHHGLRHDETADALAVPRGQVGIMHHHLAKHLGGHGQTGAAGIIPGTHGKRQQHMRRHPEEQNTRDAAHSRKPPAPPPPGHREHADSRHGRNEQSIRTQKNQPRQAAVQSGAGEPVIPPIQGAKSHRHDYETAGVEGIFHQYREGPLAERQQQRHHPRTAEQRQSFPPAPVPCHTGCGNKQARLRCHVGDGVRPQSVQRADEEGI